MKIGDYILAITHHYDSNISKGDIFQIIDILSTSSEQNNEIYCDDLVQAKLKPIHFNTNKNFIENKYYIIDQPYEPTLFTLYNYPTLIVHEKMYSFLNNQIN